MGGWDLQVTTRAVVRSAESVLKRHQGIPLDLGDRMEDVVIVTMSEFGRTRKRRHAARYGHGGMMMVVGGSSQGARSTEVAGLASEQLFEGVISPSLRIYRDVLGELVRHLARRSEHSGSAATHRAVPVNFLKVKDL